MAESLYNLVGEMMTSGTSSAVWCNLPNMNVRMCILGLPVRDSEMHKDRPSVQVTEHVFDLTGRMIAITRHGMKQTRGRYQKEPAREKDWQEGALQQARGTKAEDEQRPWHGASRPDLMRVQGTVKDARHEAR